MRALFGLLSTAFFATILTLTVGKRDDEAHAGLTAYDLDTALHRFKGSIPNFKDSGKRVQLAVETSLEDSETEDVRLPQAILTELSAETGDMLYITDTRWWWGGLRSVHARVAAEVADGENLVMTPSMYQRGGFFEGMELAVEKVF